MLGFLEKWPKMTKNDRKLGPSSFRGHEMEKNVEKGPSSLGVKFGAESAFLLLLSSVLTK